MLLCVGANSLSTGILFALFDTTHDSWLPVITAWGVFSPPCKHINNKKTSYEDFKLPGFQCKYLCPEHAEQNVAWTIMKTYKETCVNQRPKLCLICWDFLCTNVESFVQRMIYPLNHFLPESEQIDRISPCPHIPIKSTQCAMMTDLIPSQKQLYIKSVKIIT